MAQPPQPKDPTRDRNFHRFLSAWTDGTLGNKDEGLGLLWKQGAISSLLISLHRRAPETMRVAGQLLANGAPTMHDETQYVPRRLLAEFVAIMDLPISERRERFAAVELAEPVRGLTEAIALMKPPMKPKFRSALEGWIDLAATIEGGPMGPTAASASGASFVIGARVQHAQWGAGVVRDLRPGPKGMATVDFGAGGIRKTLIGFLTLTDEED